MLLTGKIFSSYDVVELTNYIEDLKKELNVQGHILFEQFNSYDE